MEKKVSLDAKALYAAFTVIASLVSSNLSYWIVLSKAENTVTDFGIYCLLSLLMVAVSLLLSWVIMLVYLFFKFPALYSKSDDKNLWAKKTLSLLLIGELARFIISVLTFRRYFDKTSVQIYQIIYGFWLDEATTGILSLMDMTVYAAVYLALLAIFLAGIFFMCKKLWALGKRDYENLYKTE